MILVQAAPGGAEKGPIRMAVVLKINPGFDASYPWRQIGTGTQPVAASRWSTTLPPPTRAGNRRADGPGGAWPRSGSLRVR